MTALANFTRLAKPVRVFAVSTGTVDDFIARRRQEPGKKRGDVVSPATVNKDLRHLKAALRVAKEWGYLAQVPRFRMEKQPKKLPTYVTNEHFADIYDACEHARLPNDLPNIQAADWWRALLIMGRVTGWRISDMLGLRWQDVDLDAATAITRAEDNKADRDDVADLHPEAVDHLRKLANFVPAQGVRSCDGTHVFAWNYNRTTLQNQFATIQEKAGIRLPCRGAHEHTRFCHVYGFHDLRRAFGTMNADKVPAKKLQTLMRHASLQTTMVYVNQARDMKETVAKLDVPEYRRPDASTAVH
jgi:integrase